MRRPSALTVSTASSVVTVSTVVAALTVFPAVTPLAAQRRPTTSAATVSADTLRARLFALADDSMGGRATDSPGNYQAADWVAAFFRRYGLQPAGDNGGYFQTIGFRRLAPDTGSALVVNGARLPVGRDIVPVGVAMTWNAGTTSAIYGGQLADSSTWPASGAAAGKVVVLVPPPGPPTATVAMFAALRRTARYAGAAAFAVVSLDALAPELVQRLMQGRPSQDTMVSTINIGQLLVTQRAAEALLGGPLATAVAGREGPAVGGSVAHALRPLRYPARNVVGILPGTDPALRGTWVSVSAHNDHVGTAPLGVDHDSMRAFNRVVRPQGADSRNRPATPDELPRIAQLRDSLRAAHPARRDSIFNGADDDGSGTVALTELARVLSQGPRPRRSILFVSHGAEEVGLVGSAWYTDHATAPTDSIVGEVDVDMIGRGGAADIPGGGPGYLEVVGSKRLSTEFGALLEAVNASLEMPFQFNYEYDAPGHPLQYYCRADHYSYARYGIPSVSLSTGEHLDYHQITDEPQYMDYAKLAGVTELAQRMVLAVANLDHRPVVDGPRGDPHARCRQ